MLPAVGEIVAYSAMAGGVYDAVVTRLHKWGVTPHVDLEVMLPGTKRRLTIHKIRWVTDIADNRRGTARTKKS